MSQAATPSGSTRAGIRLAPGNVPEAAVSDVASLRLRLLEPPMRIRSALVPLRATTSARLMHAAVWATAAALSGATTLLACTLMRELIAPVRPESSQAAPRCASNDIRSTQAAAAASALIETGASQPQRQHEPRGYGAPNAPEPSNSPPPVEAMPFVRDSATGEGASRNRKRSTQRSPMPEAPLLPISSPVTVPLPAPEVSVCAQLDAEQSRCVDSLSHLTIL